MIKKKQEEVNALEKELLVIPVTLVPSHKIPEAVAHRVKIEDLVNRDRTEVAEATEIEVEKVE